MSSIQQSLQLTATEQSHREISSPDCYTNVSDVKKNNSTSINFSG